ncbi:MAG: DUF5615 family PIN-like protein [Planctomycetota bacterium]|nr:DUF5615 family PIN-like protein [Planctomycetota bacterium]
MSRPRFLADHDLNEHLVAGVLRQEPSIEILRVRDAGMSERSDEEILAYAERAGLLVVSHDVNTMPAAAYARLTAGDSFPGLLMVQQTLPIRPIIESIVLIWSGSELEEWKDQVVYLPFD